MAEFSLHKKKAFQYILSFRGNAAFDACAGTAMLKEYAEGGRLTREIRFLFFAAKQSDKPGKKNIPFLIKSA